MKSLYLQIDECPDAMGNAILRRHDGTPNGDTESQPVATVYGDHAERIAACVNAAVGLALPDTVPPGALADLAAVLAKWHNWIASGQMAFTQDHLAESHALLRALGLPAMGPLDMALGGTIGEAQNLAPVSPPPSETDKHADEPRPSDDQIRAEYRNADDPDAVLRKYRLGSLDELGQVPLPGELDDPKTKPARSAELARRALEAYATEARAGNEDRETVMEDLLTDLLHLSEAFGWEFSEAVMNATENWEDEVKEAEARQA